MATTPPSSLHHNQPPSSPAAAAAPAATSSTSASSAAVSDASSSVATTAATASTITSSAHYQQQHSPPPPYSGSGTLSSSSFASGGGSNIVTFASLSSSSATSHHHQHHSHQQQTQSHFRFNKTPNDLKNDFLQLPIVTKVCTSAMALFLLLNLLLSEKFFTIAVMTPGWTLPPYFYLWTLVTANFYEASFLGLLISVIVFPLFGRYLENIWGSKEFIKFLLINSVASTFCLLVLYVFLYILSGVPELLYNTHVYGTNGIFLAFIVALKQLIPEHSLDIFGAFSLRVKDVPILILGFQALTLLWASSINSFLISLFSFLWSWTYLRYFQVRDNLKGDRSEAFSFASFFPERVQPIVKTFTTIIFRTLVAFRICQRVDRDYGSTDVELADFARVPASQGFDPTATERRRNLALMALEARLAKGRTSTTSSSNPTQFSPPTEHNTDSIA